MKQARRILCCMMGFAFIACSSYAAGQTQLIDKAASKENSNFTASYPELNGLNNKAGQDRINAIFAELAQKAVTGYEFTKRDHQSVEAHFGYEVTAQKNGIFSVVFTDTLQGRTPQTHKTGYTISEKTSAALMLSQLFTANSDYEGALKAIMTEKAVSQTLQAKVLRNASSFENFYVTDDALILIFNDTELQELVIEKASIGHILVDCLK